MMREQLNRTAAGDAHEIEGGGWQQSGIGNGIWKIIRLKVGDQFA